MWMLPFATYSLVCPLRTVQCLHNLRSTLTILDHMTLALHIALALAHGSCRLVAVSAHVREIVACAIKLKQSRLFERGGIYGI